MEPRRWPARWATGSPSTRWRSSYSPIGWLLADQRRSALVRRRSAWYVVAAVRRAPPTQAGHRRTTARIVAGGPAGLRAVVLAWPGANVHRGRSSAPTTCHRLHCHDQSVAHTFDKGDGRAAFFRYPSIGRLSDRRTHKITAITVSRDCRVADTPVRGGTGWLIVNAFAVWCSTAVGDAGDAAVRIRSQRVLSGSCWVESAAEVGDRGTAAAAAGQDRSCCRSASATACARSRAPSLRYSTRALAFTVSSERFSCTPISRLDSPRLMPCRIPRSPRVIV